MTKIKQKTTAAFIQTKENFKMNLNFVFKNFIFKPAFGNLQCIEIMFAKFIITYIYCFSLNHVDTNLQVQKTLYYFFVLNNNLN